MESASRWRLEHLVRFAVPGEPDMCSALLRVLTDLYVQKPTHTPDEERHYTELVLRLLDAADIGTRTIVAQRLAHYRSAPRRVIERLAGKMPNGTRRQQPSSGASIIAVDLASKLNELFFAANSDERRLILLNLDVITPFTAARGELSHEADLTARLEAAVLSRNREALAHDLAQALHISRAQARRVANDDLGEPIVIAAKALNIRRGALYRILLFINTGRSVARIQALSELHHELPARAAEHMVAIWRSLPKADRPVQRPQPMFWDNSVARPGIVKAITHLSELSPPEQREAS